MNRSCTILLLRGIGGFALPVSVTDDIEFTLSSRTGDGKVGDAEGVGESSTVSTCVVKPLAIESTDFVEPTVLRRSR